MKLIIPIIVPLLAAACTSTSTTQPKRSDLQCSEERCSASLEQHPGEADWYIVTDSECATVETGDGKTLPICGYERWVGDGNIEIKSGSCRVCERQAPGTKKLSSLVP